MEEEDIERVAWRSTREGIESIRESIMSVMSGLMRGLSSKRESSDVEGVITFAWGLIMSYLGTTPGGTTPGNQKWINP